MGQPPKVSGSTQTPLTDWEMIRLEWNVMQHQCKIDGEGGFKFYFPAKTSKDELSQLLASGNQDAQALFRYYNNKFGKRHKEFYPHWFTVYGQTNLDKAIRFILQNGNYAVYQIENLSISPTQRYDRYLIWNHQPIDIEFGSTSFNTTKTLTYADKTGIIREIKNVFRSKGIYINEKDVKLIKSREYTIKKKDGSKEKIYKYISDC